MTFAQPLWFAALLLLPLLFFLRNKGHVGFSDNRLLADGSSIWLRLLARLPVLLGAAVLILTVLALARPQIPGEPENRKIRGRDIVLAVDISYSMSFDFKGDVPEQKAPEGLDFKGPVNQRRKGRTKGLQFEKPEDGKLKRIDASQYALLKFIENRWRQDTGDRIGLIVFDVLPRYAWPITDDLRMLYRKAQFIKNGLGTGTNFGDRGPGPIDLAVEHFKERGEAKSRVLIMVTDGEDQISGTTKWKLIDLLQENNIRLYLVGIGETLANKDVDIIRLAESVGGRVFRVEDTNSLNECFATIDKLEKSEVTLSQLETRDDVFFYFAWAALACFGLLLVTETVVLTR